MAAVSSQVLEDGQGQPQFSEAQGQGQPQFSEAQGQGQPQFSEAQGQGQPQFSEAQGQQQPSEAPEGQPLRASDSVRLTVRTMQVLPCSIQQDQGLLQFSILVCGKTGIGKSSLINFILGEDVCEVGDPGTLGATLKPTTKKVEIYEVRSNGVLLTIFDSPGLQDGTDNDEEYLAEMYAKCRDVHLIFYCHDMPSTRWTDHEVKAIRLLTEKFGPTFWDRAIFVLTKANLIQPTTPMSEEESKVHFRNWTDNVTKMFRTEVQKQLTRVENLPVDGEHSDWIQKHVESIPVVPTGSIMVQFLPNEKHYIGDLWVNCMQRIKDPHLSAVFLQVTNAQERLITYDDIKREGYKYGITMEGVMRAGSHLTGYVAPVRKCIVKLFGSSSVVVHHKTEDSEMTPVINQTSQQPSSALESAQPTTHTEELISITDNKMASLEPTSQAAQVSEDEPPTQANDCRAIVDPQNPKYLLIVDKSSASRLLKDTEEKEKAIMKKWTKGGAIVGAVIGIVVPILGNIVGAGVGAAVGRLLGWLKNRLSEKEE